MPPQYAAYNALLCPLYISSYILPQLEYVLLRLSGSKSNYISDPPTHLFIFLIVGQGALGIECRANDEELKQLLQIINHKETWIKCTAERAFMRTLQGGCHVPVGVVTTLEGQKVHLKGRILNLDGSQCVESEKQGSISDAGEIGKELALECLKQGGDEILKSLPAARQK